MSAPTAPPLAAAGLSVTVPGRVLLDGLDLSLAAGEFVAVLGRNGAGKSLTLHTLAGLRRPAAGRVLLDGEPLDGLSRRQIARRLALLPQVVDDVFPASALDTVMTGRHPHIPPLALESERDRAIAADALAMVGLTGFDDRDVETLSGGERRRLAIAQVLAQAPCVYLLDEPTNHLDPQHQLEALELFSRLAAGRGAAVIAALHDVNLAARYADRCLLLHGDGRWALGATPDILSVERLESLFNVRMEMLDWRGLAQFVASPAPPHESDPAA